MAASPPAVDSPSALRTRLASLQNNPQPPGTLTKWSDGQNNAYWEFTGNGQTTATELVQTTLQREAEGGNKDVQPVADSRAFAEAAASQLLQTDSPNQPIPAGEVKELSLKDLVAQIAPFLNSYAAQQRQAQGPGTGAAKPAENREGDVDARARVATGQVVSQGLTLPLD